MRVGREYNVNNNDLNGQLKSLNPALKAHCENICRLRGQYENNYFTQYIKMLDNITLKLENFTDTDFENLCHYIGIEKPINSNHVWFYWENLLISYYPNKKELTIKNSVHKFYNAVYNDLIAQPVNYNDFNLFHMWCLADYLSEFVFKRPMTDFKVFAKFEYGVNIDTGQLKPFSIIERWLSYVNGATNPYFTNAPNKGKPLGRTCQLTEYRVKAYDKGRVAGLTDTNLLRYEIALNGLKMLRQVLKIEDISLQDLISYQTWDTLHKHMLSVYDNTHKLPFVTDKSVSIEDVLTTHAYCDKLVRNDLKEILSREQYKKLMKDYQQVFKKHADNPANIHNQIRQKIINKYYDLLLPCPSLQP